MSETKTLAGAYAKIESHEELCAERYDTIRDKLADAKDGIKEIKDWAKAGVIGIAGIAVTLGGFMAHEIYNNLQRSPPAAAVQGQ